MHLPRESPSECSIATEVLKRVLMLREDEKESLGEVFFAEDILHGAVLPMCHLCAALMMSRSSTLPQILAGASGWQSS